MEGKLIWNKAEGAYMGNLCRKILPGHFHITSHKPLSGRVAAATGGAGCELFAAESSSKQSQSLGNSSRGPEMVSKAALEKAFPRAQVWVAHLVFCEQDRPVSTSMQPEDRPPAM